MMRALPCVCAVIVTVVALVAAPVAEAKRYVGLTSDAAPSAVSRVRWGRCPVGAGASPSCRTVLRARYRCRGEGAFQAVQCPSATRGKLLAEMQHAGDFDGWLAFKDGVTCRISGLLTSRDSVLWQNLPPEQAPRMVIRLGCGPPPDYEDSHWFIGEVP